MIVNSLKRVYDKNEQEETIYLRNLLKEELQLYILNFIYNSVYAERFIFKGGTCLRFCSGLPRLSEDLDFDVEDFNNFSFEEFSSDINDYFKSKLKYKEFNFKISGRHKLIYLKFPLLEQIGFPVKKEKPTDNVLFVRIDLSSVRGKFFTKKTSLKSTSNFSFLIRKYTLPDLFSSKVFAILERKFMDGKKLKPRFKGRDYFDLFWFIEKKTKFNYKYFQSLSGIKARKKFIGKLDIKLKEAVKRKKEIKNDLFSFFRNRVFVENFGNNLEEMRIEAISYFKKNFNYS